MKFPTVDEVTIELTHVQDWLDAENSETDVRLQVYEDGAWAVRFGASDYDQDHQGYWGASVIDVDYSRGDLRAVAEDLIDQAKDHAADNGEEV